MKSVQDATQLQIKQPEKQRLLFLDFLRGIAVLAVFFEHTSLELYPQFKAFTHSWFNFGKFGVVTFFLVSGFIIPFSLERSQSVKKFWISRFFRLYPLYWISLSLFVLLYACNFRAAIDAEARSNWIGNALINITMLQEFLGVPHIRGLYYTLTLELLFYVACSVLFLLKLHRKSYIWAWAVLGLVAIGSIITPIFLDKRLPMAGLFYLLTLFVGTAIYRYYCGILKQRDLTLLLFATALVAIVGSIVNYMVYPKADVSERLSFFSVISPWFAGYLLFFVAFALRETKFPHCFCWLGKISYSVYLLHPIFFAFLPLPIPGLFCFSLIFSGTIALSTLTYNWIEAPCIQWGRKIGYKLPSTQ